MLAYKHKVRRICFSENLRHLYFWDLLENSYTKSLTKRVFSCSIVARKSVVAFKLGDCNENCCLHIFYFFLSRISGNGFSDGW